ncbi:MAG TPA: SRPBCC family protein [Actinomycetota bacterium]|nr:SRPBCC family protein [Actinomycetota bacterium]
MPDPKRMTISVSRAARCDPAAVMDLVLDPETWPRWQPEIVSTEGPAPLTEDDDVYGHASMLGFRVEGHSKSMNVSGDYYEEDVIVGVRMRVVYEVGRDESGNTVVKRTLSALLPGGIAGRILSIFLKRRLTRMQNGVVEELVRQAERAS